MFEKVKIAFAPHLDVEKYIDLITKYYGDRAGFYIEEPLVYKSEEGHGIYYSYGEWVKTTNRFANAMRYGLGIQKGDRVALVPGNGIEMLTLIVAAMRIGAIAVPMNYMLRSKEIKHIVEDSGAKVLFTDPTVFTNNIGDASVLPTVERWVMVSMSGKAPEPFLSMDELLEDAADSMKPVGISPEDVVGIFYTSGTTGFPKGAMLTSKGLLQTQCKAAAVLPIGVHDFGVFALPVSHIFGFAIAVMAASAGVSAYIMQYFDPEKVLQAIEEYKATLYVGVPTMYALLLMSSPERYDLTSLKLLGSAADSMPAEHIEALKELASRRWLIFKRKPLFAEAYGMVELTALATLKPAFRWLKWPKSCVGVPMPPVRTKIVDENGERLKTGEPGELAVKGPGVMKGYWNNPEATELALRDGWLYTGDIAFKDRWHRINFVDRAKDVIKCGGYSIFSVEVEREILAHPEVVEAAVVAIPHRSMGQVPLAVVCLQEGSDLGEDDIVAWCRENIAEYKAPRMVKIIPIGEMPFGMTLKVLKRELRDRFFEELGMLGT